MKQKPAHYSKQLQQKPQQKQPKPKKDRAAKAPRQQSGQHPGQHASDADQDVSAGERINRYLASCGLCSRREADRWVAGGRVIINNEACQEPGSKVKPGDIVRVDGKVVSPQESFTYILYNKPTGQLCSRKDAIRKRPLIYDFLNVAPNVQSVGRLDMDSEGLLILTDDGALTRALTKPGAKVPREYRARVAGLVDMETLAKLRRGDIDMGKGDSSDAWEVTVDSESKGHTWLSIVIYRGRWREVRRTLEECGHPVRRLMRIRFASLRLDEGMPRGSFRNLNRSEVKKLKERLT
ncbi:MAG: pseudouridine synthase [Mariprofundus sp.]|nr:pseudouridine synthase [Mariprofundus sp.]